MELKNIFSQIGNYVVFAFDRIIKYVASLGLNINETQIKIISLIILLSFLYIIQRFLIIGNKMIKRGIMILILILILSIIFTF